MTSHTSASSSHFVMPFVMCGPCQNPFTTENFPIMSKSCPHSICVDCLHRHYDKNNNDNHNDNDNHTANKYFACPICHENDAFHSKHSQPNYIAVASLDLMQQTTHLLVKQSKQLVRLEKQVQSKKQSSTSKRFMMNAIPAKRRVSLYDKNSPSNNNNNKKNNHQKPNGNRNDKDHLMTSTPPVVNITVPETSSEESDGESTTMEPAVTTKKKRSVVVPPPPGTERMVWVKFEASSQLAFLLSVQDDKATVRWESYKYTEVVDVDRIEEMDNNNNSNNQASSRAKRRCRGSAAQPYGDDYDHGIVPGNHNQKKKQRKDY